MDRTREAMTPAASGAQVVACPGCAVDRRTILMGAGAAGVAGLLSACGGNDETTGGTGGATGTAGTEPTGAGPTADTEPSTPPPEQTPTPEETETGAGQTALASTSEVPVGGGVILNGPGVVVTQPSEGQFAAFSATCTHQGCAVTGVAAGLITCPCHGSQYSVTDGSVQTGPAQAPLPKVAIVVEGGQILPG